MSTAAIVWTVIGGLFVLLVVAAAIAVRRDEKRDAVVAGLRIEPQRWQSVPAHPALFGVFNRFWGFWAERDPNLDTARPEPGGAVSVRKNDDDRDVVSGVRRTAVGALPVVSFTYHLVITNKKRGSTHTTYYSVAAARLPVPRPALVVSPENITSRLRTDLQMESIQFNAAFNVAGSDPRFAYAVLCPRVMDFLMHDPRARYFTLTVDGNDMTVFQQNSNDPDTRLLDAVADYLIQVLRRVPDYVWR